MITYNHVREAEARRQYAVKIQSRLFGMGYGVSQKRIHKNYRQFVAWYEGRLALGYLIRQTGIRKAEHVNNG